MRLARLWQVDLPQGAARLADIEAAAALRFQSLYGDAPGLWHSSSAWDARAPFFCAVPRALLAQLTRVADARKLALIFITPQFARHWNRWHGALKPGAWFGQLQENALTLGVRHDGQPARRARAARAAWRRPWLAGADAWRAKRCCKACPHRRCCSCAARRQRHGWRRRESSTARYFPRRTAKAPCRRPPGWPIAEAWHDAPRYRFRAAELAPQPVPRARVGVVHRRRWAWRWPSRRRARQRRAAAPAAREGQLQRAQQRVLAATQGPAPWRPAPIAPAQAAAVNAAILQLNLPWRDLQDALASATPPDVALLALEPDARKRVLKITAETTSSDAMVAYVAQLKQQELFGTRVQLLRHEINALDPNKPLRFQLEARWGTP